MWPWNRKKETRDGSTSTNLDGEKDTGTQSVEEKDIEKLLKEYQVVTLKVEVSGTPASVPEPEPPSNPPETVAAEKQIDAPAEPPLEPTSAYKEVRDSVVQLEPSLEEPEDGLVEEEIPKNLEPSPEPVAEPEQSTAQESDGACSTPPQNADTINGRADEELQPQGSDAVAAEKQIDTPAEPPLDSASAEEAHDSAVQAEPLLEEPEQSTAQEGEGACSTPPQNAETINGRADEELHPQVSDAVTAEKQIDTPAERPLEPAPEPVAEPEQPNVQESNVAAADASPPPSEETNATDEFDTLFTTPSPLPGLSVIGHLPI